MINNVVFPHSVEVRPSFVVGKLKDETGGATTRVFAHFELVKNYSLDAYGNPTIANMHDPIYMDLTDKRIVDPASFTIITKFDPNNIGSAVLKLQQEVSDRDAKIDTLDKMVKQLSAGNDPRVANLMRANDFAQQELAEVRRDYNAQERRADDLSDALRRQSTTLASSGKEVAELKEKVTKLTNDLLATANQRDNRVEVLAKEKANEMLPNLRRDVEFYKRRAKDLANELKAMKVELDNATESAELDAERSKDSTVPLWRNIRKLEKKLRKAKGRERYWVRQIEIERKNSGPRFAQVETLKKRVAELENNLTTVNSAFAAERAFAKEQVRTVGTLEEALADAKTYEVQTCDGKTVNITLNVCGNVTINELNNYN